MIKKFYFFLIKKELFRRILIVIYKLNGQKPWTLGYNEYKWETIEKSLKSKSVINAFKNKIIPSNFGLGIDERIVEYPWVFANMTDLPQDLKILDAGSVFNYSSILNLNFFKNKMITIFTYNPEGVNFAEKRISYVYGDLRDIPFRSGFYDRIVCQSTLEHVDMDNSIYGYEIENSSKRINKSYQYLRVIEELYRVLAKRGELLLTFPFGKYENHGFFQQFDSEMVGKIRKFLSGKGKVEFYFIKYSENGWNFAEETDCQDSISYNPHTGRGRGEDGAAHCRAVCCIKFLKT